MDVRALIGARPEGRSSGWRVVQGYVSRSRPAPSSFSDPMWVIVPSFSTDRPYGPLTWPVLHGDTLPVKGTPVTLGLANGLDGLPGVPVVLAWDGTFSLFPERDPDV